MTAGIFGVAAVFDGLGRDALKHEGRNGLRRCAVAAVGGHGAAQLQIACGRGFVHVRDRACRQTGKAEGLVRLAVVYDHVDQRVERGIVIDRGQELVGQRSAVKTAADRALGEAGVVAHDPQTLGGDQVGAVGVEVDQRVGVVAVVGGQPVAPAVHIEDGEILVHHARNVDASGDGIIRLLTGRAVFRLTELNVRTNGPHLVRQTFLGAGVCAVGVRADMVGDLQQRFVLLHLIVDIVDKALVRPHAGLCQAEFDVLERLIGLGAGDQLLRDERPELHGFLSRIVAALLRGARPVVLRLVDRADVLDRNTEVVIKLHHIHDVFCIRFIAVLAQIGVGIRPRVAAGRAADGHGRGRRIHKEREIIDRAHLQ